MSIQRLVLAAALVAAIAFPATAQPPDAEARLAAQRTAMQQLAFLDGEWRGTAWMLTPSGDKHTLTQTERIGAFLDGTVKVIEGRGYEPDGTASFNAFAIVSYDPTRETFTMRSYTMGRTGDFPLTPTPDGFMWEIPSGPATIRYTATIADGEWRQIGERIVEGREPIQFFGMDLKRLGDTDWPAAGAVQPR